MLLACRHHNKIIASSRVVTCCFFELPSSGVFKIRRLLADGDLVERFAHSLPLVS